jgi:VIT1/CCC1 family predicted Fe2+/Mn2+ transporter
MSVLGAKAEHIYFNFISETNPHRATMGSIVARWTQPFLPFLPFFLVFSSDSSFPCTVALISSFLGFLGLFPRLLLLILSK